MEGACEAAATTQPSRASRSVGKRSAFRQERTEHKHKVVCHIQALYFSLYFSLFSLVAHEIG